MKPFRFGLEKVLTLRKYTEEEAKIELGRAVGVVKELENALVSLAHEEARAAAAQFSPDNSAVMMQQYMFYLIRLDNRREELQKEAAIAEMQLEKAREEFLEASRERKVLDNLKEKRQKEHRKLFFAEETKSLDDMFAARR